MVWCSCHKVLGKSSQILRLRSPSLIPSHLQYDPVALLGSLLHGNLSHGFLALAQRHVVKLPQVDSETQLPSWETQSCIF